MLVWEDLNDVKRYDSILDKIAPLAKCSDNMVPLSRSVKASFKAWEYPFTYLWLKELDKQRRSRNKNLLPLRVMDFGCGVSMFPEFLAREGFDAWGVDNDAHHYIEPVKEDMRKCYPNVKYWIDDVFNFPEATKFDAIVSCSVLEHLTPSAFRLKVVRKLKSLLKPTGKMLHVVDFYFPEMGASEDATIDMYEMGQEFSFDVGDLKMCPGSPIFDFEKIRDEINFIVPLLHPIKPKKKFQARIAIGDDI